MRLEHLNAGLQRAKDFPKLEDLLGKRKLEQTPEEMASKWRQFLGVEPVEDETE